MHANVRAHCVNVRHRQCWSQQEAASPLKIITKKLRKLRTRVAFQWNSVYRPRWEYCWIFYPDVVRDNDVTVS